jgi:hypothetical protein
MLQRELNRIADIAVDAVDATGLHVGRIVGALYTALGRAKREVGDLAWDYNELAGSARRSARHGGAVTEHRGQATQSEHIAEVVSIDLRRRKAN